MVLGMSLATYTLIHVLISVIGIGSGLVVLYGLLVGKPLNGITAIFLVSTLLTSATGFGFPFEHLLPSHKLAILSFIVLALAFPARYLFHMTGSWRWIYAVTASIALYFNVFVLIVQSFEKVPSLKAAAPTQKEPPFLIAQLVVLVAFAILTILAAVRFHPERVRTA
jgi:hypothetical protein